MNDSLLFRGSREKLLMLVAFLVAAVFFIAMSVWATTVGTNVDSTGTIGAATSTPWGTLAAEQTATQGRLDPTFVVGDSGSTTPFIFVSPKGIVSFGSSSPSALFLNAADVVIGRNGSTNDLFVSGGLGVGNATTADDNLQVQTRIYAGTVISTGSYFYSAGSATSTFTSSGLSVSTGGLASSGGLTVTGGTILNTDTSTSTFSGGISAGTSGLLSSKGLTLTGGVAQLGANVFATSDLFVGGTTTQALADFAIGSATAGTNNNAYISGGLGVANATTSNGDFVVGTGPTLSVTANGRLVVGASTTAAQSGSPGIKFIFDGGDAMISSGGTGTTTLSIVNEAATGGNNSCIEMSRDGAIYRIFVATANNALTVEAGSCSNQ